MSLRQLIAIYHALLLVGSRLAYGICLWGLCTRTNQVFIADKRLIRVIAFDYIDTIVCSLVIINKMNLNLMEKMSTL